ncbi:hypothetical protein evm_011072 [Chilo suppressalis]|nr:hypothetical protein evm_011072 [Chilo suppressalis]
MALGWIFIMTTAINAITPGDLATEWMPIRLRSARHWLLQLLGGIILVIGFLVILFNKILNEKPHFVTLHAKFGLASLIFMGLTMLGGLGALYSLKLKNYLAPIYTKLLHASVGLVTFTLGIITISLGQAAAYTLFTCSASKEGSGHDEYVNTILVMPLPLALPGAPEKSGFLCGSQIPRLDYAHAAAPRVAGNNSLNIAAA